MRRLKKERGGDSSRRCSIIGLRVVQSNNHQVLKICIENGIPAYLLQYRPVIIFGVKLMISMNFQVWPILFFSAEDTEAIVLQ